MRVYPWLFQNVLTKFDPETAHHLAFAVIKVAGAVRGVIRPFFAPDRSLQVHTMGLTFSSPFGVAAGFDKDARGIIGLGTLGFGHVEVGTLTALSQAGNARPRLFRLVQDRAVINRMGFNNRGSIAAVPHIENARLRRDRPVIGVNIGKSRAVQVDDATDDYVLSAERLAPIADYLVVNVSSPNTPGLRGLQDRDQLEPLLTRVKEVSRDTPLLVKIAPDMNDDQIDDTVDLVVSLGLDGIIATNTTISREGLEEPFERVEEIGTGGLSGAPLASRSFEVLRRIRTTAPRELCVISVGGVTTAQDVAERLDAGATLVQGYTGFLYEGPAWARNINRGLKSMGWRSHR